MDILLEVLAMLFGSLVGFIIFCVIMNLLGSDGREKIWNNFALMVRGIAKFLKGEEKE